MKLILASGSPRRKELLGLITGRFEVIVPATDETVPSGTGAEEAVLVISKRKAQEISSKFPEAAVIGADTVVELDGAILGKPKDHEDAVRMLTLLADKTHRVHTGVSLFYPGGSRQIVETTSVRFMPMSEKEIRDYTNTGEPMDKAGAYGIQGFGSVYIPYIEGDYYNVMGLPVSALYSLLKEEKILPMLAEDRCSGL